MEKPENVKQVQCQEVREAAGIICDILIHIMIMRLLIESYWITGYQLIYMLVDQNMLLDTYYILVCGNRYLYDKGYLSHPEPFQKLYHQGMILGTNGEKMSKSKGNVINPDDIVQTYGADTLRVYEMFMVPWKQVNHGVKQVLTVQENGWIVCIV